MRILILGGNGFIGRFLTPQVVAAGHEVAIVHRSAERTIPGADAIAADHRDLPSRAAALRAFRPDVVVDLLLSSGRQAADLLTVFRGHAGRLVAISSMDVYRATAVMHGADAGPLEPLPLTEDSALRTGALTYPPPVLEMLKGIFGWVDDAYDKVAVERVVREDSTLPATVLRLPMIHGPGDQLHRLVPLLKRMDDGRPVIPMAEHVAAWRGSRGYVENIAAAITLAATDDRAAGRTYNVGDADSLSELEWGRAIGEAAAWRGRFVVLPDDQVPPYLLLPGRLEQHWVTDTSRIRRELGYAEPVDRMTGLRRTIAWERANPPPVNPAMFDYAAEDRAVAGAG